MQSKQWCHSHKLFYVLFSVTQFFLLGFSWTSDNITVDNKKRTSKKEPTSVSEITIQRILTNFTKILKFHYLASVIWLWTEYELCHFQAYSGIIQPSSKSCVTWQNQRHIQNLVYPKLWHIQNQRQIQNPGLFRTLGHSEPEAYSEPCQTSTTERFEKRL